MATYIPPVGEALVLPTPPPGVGPRTYMTTLYKDPLDGITFLVLPTPDGSVWWVATGEKPALDVLPVNPRATAWLRAREYLLERDIRGPVFYMSGDEVSAPQMKPVIPGPFVSKLHPGTVEVRGPAFAVRSRLASLGVKFDPSGTGHWMVSPTELVLAQSIVDEWVKENGPKRKS